MKKNHQSYELSSRWWVESDKFLSKWWTSIKMMNFLQGAESLSKGLYQNDEFSSKRWIYSKYLLIFIYHNKISKNECFNFLYAFYSTGKLISKEKELNLAQPWLILILSKIFLQDICITKMIDGFLKDL